MIVRRFAHTAALGYVLLKSLPDNTYAVWHAGVKLGGVRRRKHMVWIIEGRGDETFTSRAAALEVLAVRHRAAALLSATTADWTPAGATSSAA